MIKLINYALLLWLAIAPVCFGQDLIVQHNNQEQVLYRFFKNSIAVSLGNLPFEDLNFKCVNCEIQSDNTKNSIIILTKEGSTAELIVSSKSNPNKEVKQVFKVQGLPNPQVFMGYKESGEIVSINDLYKKISVGYPSYLLLKNDFRLIEWELSMDGTTIIGASDSLSIEAIELLTSRDANTFTFRARIASKTEGIERKLDSIFVLQKN